MSRFTKRYFNKAAALTVAALFSEGSKSQQEHTKEESRRLIEDAEKHHVEMMTKYGHLTGGEKVKIGMVVYPGMFLLDLIGPLAVFEALMNREIYLIWKNRTPVNNTRSEYAAYIPIEPSHTFESCPTDLDVLFVPGGVPGTLAMMEDPELMSFLRTKGSKARFITSVCTGSLILASAGLLNGYRATSHWVTKESLRHFGAIPGEGRVVKDRNRITGGGVTAGIDFGLEIIALLRSPEYAKAVQLYLEYDPSPPFNAGSPKTAPAIIRGFIEDMFAGLRVTIEKIAKKVIR
jgi:cyclohexyl-isocyanide hydratase